jgi:hypothetical protein
LETHMPSMTVSGHSYHLDSRQVEAALQGTLPEPIREHLVVINGRRWPPKQVRAFLLARGILASLPRDD